MATERNIVQDQQPVENIVWKSYDRPLAAMRRTQLWRLADLHGIKYPRGASKDIMLRLVDNWEISHGEGSALKPPAGMSAETFLSAIQGPEVRYDERRADQSTGQTKVGAYVEAIEGVSHFETDIPSDMPSLRRMAKELNLKQSPKMTAAELQEAIRRGKDTA